MSTDTRPRFNKKALENVPLPQPGSCFTLHDSEVPGLRVTDRGTKSFCVFRRSNRTTADGGTLPALAERQLEGRHLCAVDTKNRSDHVLPMGRYLWELMQRRRRASDSDWVFANP